MDIDVTKNPEKMSKQELRAEVSAWRTAKIDHDNSIAEMQSALTNRDNQLHALGVKVAGMIDRTRKVLDDATALLAFADDV